MLSVIIPVFREQRRLPRTLAGLVPAARAIGAELIVVDGGSPDGTREIVRRFPDVALLDAPRGRGVQMNRGALRARGSLLVFLPADTTLPPPALLQLARIDRAGVPSAGGFRLRFDRDRRFLRAVAALSNLRATLTGVIYGDQVPFVRRELFLALGGYREDLDMEDVEFGTRLRRRARPRLQRIAVTTSARRFDRFGDLRATAEAARLLFCRSALRHVPRSRTFFTPVR